jgi:predicted dehydrogenase
MLREAEVRANCDLDLEKARLVARRHGILKSYEDFRQMVKAENPDGVIVCVGPDFHARAACELMGMGIHVYTEKPPAVSAAQCREVAQARRWPKRSTRRA